MTINHLLIVIHVVVLGYWLGADLVINHTYRYVAYRSDMPTDERAKLMSHVLDVDQHVRYALIIQLTLGLAIAARIGYVPGGNALAYGAGVLALGWLAFIEFVHRLRYSATGRTLATVDRASRYVLIAVLSLFAIGLIGGQWPTPAWLRWKLGLFAAVMACGVGIRLILIEHYRVWAIIERRGATRAANLKLRHIYRRSSAVLALLWILIIAIAALSVAKPSGLS
ncbi:MAG: hypothetical protein R3288_11115 [Woeseiaceae bacterium]|nr:hypothetical protein [Woeseiaceae bacterium]